jgi:hypothetical protein
MADPLLRNRSSSEPQHSRVSKRQPNTLEPDSDNDDNATSKRQRPNSGNANNNDSDSDKSTGGLSDHDERNGDERRFARESPLKGKKRLNSQVSNVIPG